ncbi:MAG: hypothetical protein CVV02_04580 [Firmicutes bacterium HGW-Firmicutes-7]|nr:MAG: hypothetical protein CVV02_04580 [Firmicutes bacterium HGW-Firmicutes-7]
MEITVGKDTWEVRSFVTISATGECYSYDELSDEDKRKYAEIFNERAFNVLGYKKDENEK